jgi:glycosyltransferase involved in cell wall biosynthesis
LAADAGARRRFGQAGRRRVEARFSLEACVGRYLALYTGLIEGYPGAVSDLIARAAEKGGRR